MGIYIFSFLVVKTRVTKDEAENNLFEYIELLKTQNDTQVKRIKMDNEGEFISNNLKSNATKNCIEFEYTVLHSPQINGKAGRMNESYIDLSEEL